MDGHPRVIGGVARILLGLGMVIGPGSPAALGAAFPQIEVWLDRPLPQEAAAGETVGVGAMVWDRVRNQVMPGMPISIRVTGGDDVAPSADPAASGAAGGPVRAVEDWPGHVAAEIGIPAGGLGAVEFGIVGDVCVNDACRLEFEPLTVAGVGPPTGAPVPAVADVTVALIPEDADAGEPVEVEVVIVPKVDWGPDAFPPPATVRLELRRQRGPVADEADAALTDPARLGYTGTLVAGEPGQYTVQVSAVDGNGRAALFAGPAARLSVAGPPASVAPGVASNPGLLEPWVLPGVLVIAVSLVAAVLVARRLDA
jgi:hypothetical protein